MKVTVSSWQYDFKLSIQRTRLVSDATAFLAQAHSLPPDHVHISLPDGTYLNPLKTFCQQNIHSEHKLVFIVGLEPNRCKHKQSPIFSCLPCEKAMCGEKDCLQKHVHYPRLQLKIQGELTIGLAFELLTCLIREKLTRYEQILSHLQKQSSSSIMQKINHRYEQLRSLANHLLLSPEQHYRQNIRMPDSTVIECVKDLTYLNPRFRMTSRVNQKSLVAQFCRAATGNVKAAFKTIFKLDGLIFQFIKVKSQFDQSLQKNLQRVIEYHDILKVKVQQSLNFIKLSQGESQAYHSFKAKFEDMLQQHEKRIRLETHLSGNSWTCFISADKFESIREKMQNKFKNLGGMGHRFQLRIVPALRGGGELIRAELIFNDSSLTDLEIQSYIEYSKAREQINMILSANELIKEQFQDIYHKFFDTPEYRSTIKFIQDEAEFERKFKSKAGGPTLVDIVFCMDCTGSMVSYINEAKRIVGDIAAKYLERNKDDSLLFGFVGYRDHGDINVTERIELTTYQKLKLKIGEIKLLGGFDHCQAVLDGLYKACKISFREDSLRIIFLICDSPPHGRQFHEQVEAKSSLGSYDRFPEGCPCGKTFGMIKEHLQKKRIRFCFMPIKQMAKTSEFFKQMFVQSGYETKRINEPVDLKKEVIDYILKNKELATKLNSSLALRLQDTLELMVRSMALQIEQFYGYLTQIENMKDIEKHSLELVDSCDKLKAERIQILTKSSEKTGVIDTKKRIEQLLIKKKNKTVEKGLQLLSTQIQ